MSNLTDILTDIISERDGIHPAHAANRVALATRVAEVVVQSRWGRPSMLEGRITDCDRMILTGAVQPASGTLSDETIALARQIVALID